MAGERLKNQPMEHLNRLSRREREIMEIIFSIKEGTLSEIQDRMEDAPTRPALRSLLTILEEKGVLDHTKKGREFVFRPVQAPALAGKNMLRRVLDTFFGGSFSQALSTYLSDPKSRLTEEEIRELSAFVEKAKATPGKAKRGKNPS